MKISIVGSRGIPALYGGFETFAEELSVNLVQKYNIEILVVCDADQKRANGGLSEYKGVKLLYSRFAKGKNPLLFYLDSILVGTKHSQIVYSCGVGGGYWGFLPGLYGKIFVTNPDGVGWHRTKWSWIVKKFLRSMYYFSAKFSDYFVCDSQRIAKLIEDIYSYRNSYVIEYGAYINPFIDEETAFVDTVLRKYNLKKNSYHLLVSRLEPENNVDMILRAYALQKRLYPLVIVGNLKKTKYVDQIRELANQDVRFIGGIYGKDELSIVRANAIDYIHGHSVGGTNPSLLEALASGNLCVCHDNVFNREVVMEYGYFFRDEGQLSNTLRFIENVDPSFFNFQKKGALERIKSHYSWDLITERYFSALNEIYRKTGRVTQK